MKAKYFRLCYWIGKRVGKFTALVLALLLVFIPAFFITPPKAYAIATAPSLGTASTFSVLAGLSMSAAGAGTTVSGDLGLSPGLEVSKTGPWTVGGGEYFGTGGLSEDAQTDALSAFNDLAGQTSDGGWGTSPWSPEPGVWTVALDTTFTGTITLDGDYDDVWVFQVGQDMVFSGSVVLAGNAQACHVFWQIGRDATIALGSTFVGILIASRDITLVSGATVNGQIISLNSSLTTDGNTISGPTCESAPTPTATPTPTGTLTPTPTPTPGSSSSSNGSTSSPATKVCPNLNCVTPLVIESRRVDADSIYISWGPYAGISTFIVQYGLENGKWLYNTRVTGFSTTINALPPNQPIWVLIEPTDDCSVGPCGVAKLVGGPRLPNTGIGSYKDYTFWYIVAGLLVFSPLLLKARRVWYKK